MARSSLARRGAVRFKVRPDDFLVEERMRLPLARSGGFAIYRVRKRGLTSLEVQERLAALLRVRRSAVTVPALKDKEAVTVQYVSVRGSGPPRLEADSWSAEYVGVAERPLSPDDLEGNRFTVVVRDLSDEERLHVLARVPQVRRHGLPNYFDEQRFGSRVRGEGYVGKKVLQGDAESALKMHLTAPMAGDPPQVRRFKEQAAAHWGEWARLLELAPQRTNFRSVLTYLKDHPADFKRALDLVTPQLLALYLAAYQSLLWNRMAARLLEARLRAHDVAPAAVEVAEERLTLYHELPVALLEALRPLRLPLLHRRVAFADPEVERLAALVLQEEGLTPGHLKARLLTRAYLPRGERPLLLFPQEMALLEEGPDEAFSGRWRLTLTLTLPPGSYATLVLKALAA